MLVREATSRKEFVSPSPTKHSFSAAWEVACDLSVRGVVPGMIEARSGRPREGSRTGMGRWLREDKCKKVSEQQRDSGRQVEPGWGRRNCEFPLGGSADSLLQCRPRPVPFVLSHLLV